MAAMHKYVKDVKNNHLLWNQKADDLESCYSASGSQVIQNLFKYDHGVDLTYFTARPTLVPYAFVWEKGKTMDFSETIIVYDIKVR